MKQQSALRASKRLLAMGAALALLGLNACQVMPWTADRAAVQSSVQRIETGLGGSGSIALQLRLPDTGFRTQSQCTLDEHLKSLQLFLISGATPFGSPPAGDLGDLTALALPDADTFYVYEVNALSSPAETLNLVFENVPPGTYYIAAAAHNTDDASGLNISLASPPYLPAYGRINGHVVAVSRTGGESANPGRVIVDNDYQVADTAPLGLTLQLANTCPLSYTNLDMTFNYIAPGSYTRGSSVIAGSDPAHTVHLTQGFYLQTTEVTQGMWIAVMGGYPPADPPSNGVGDDYPMHNVSWDDIQDFLAAINLLGQGTYRLPSEAEWEYAARAGTTTDFSCSSQPGACPQDYAWTSGNVPPPTSTMPVASKLPNPWGLYDMHGNVQEWVQDIYQLYPAGPLIDPVVGGGGNRVARNGGWSNSNNASRSATRHAYSPGLRENYLGFRLVKVN